MSIYANNPLLSRYSHIRLLRIISVSKTPLDRVTCAFSTFDINSAPKYQALSYEWGPTSPTMVIDVMGQPARIRSNLWNFLSRLRSHGYEDYLWCDAICIDQSNDYERNHQVQLMSQIYRKAHSVLRAKIWQGLVALSRRRYWTRIWIVQEITVARDLQLFCGNETVQWSAFATACKFPSDQSTPWAAELWTPLNVEDDRKQNLRRSRGREIHHSTMYGLIKSQKRWPKFVESFETLFVRYQDSGCEDPRDRIFTLLSISKEVVLERGFNADYKLNMEDTFLSLMAWGATGPVKIDSRIKFALLAVESMDLRWLSYKLESALRFESQRSWSYFKWIQQPLAMTVRCQRSGKWPLYNQRSKGRGLDTISDSDDEDYSIRSLPLEISSEFVEYDHGDRHDLDLFGFARSDIRLICIPAVNRRRTWTVVARPSYQFLSHNEQTSEKAEKRNDRELAPTVFEGLDIVEDASERFVLELKNVAQFMEILLTDRGPLPSSSTTAPGRGKGGGSLAAPTNDKARGLNAVLKGLRIISPITLTAEEEPATSEEDSENESTLTDWKNLVAESEVLAKVKIRKPPIDKPRLSHKLNCHLPAAAVAL
ncbi:hypothetical protein NA56DRAFT_688308 [Hyaloscypha hepaticicola]|uniref:Heterokaryon incompatibility domain-containing protein n=1 Tax=Hyaloscypha hepaticicola TaxID=2082293 RepID=A0A2J6Q7C6_9HELO|nr:hypothetical protein NA56DRAFT_688308 [Hyaloscypha hepaticicola]